MSEQNSVAESPSAPPPSGTRMVLYGALFALLMMLLGLLARERSQAAAAKPFPTADGQHILVSPPG